MLVITQWLKLTGLVCLLLTFPAHISWVTVYFMWFSILSFRFGRIIFQCFKKYTFSSMTHVPVKHESFSCCVSRFQMTGVLGGTPKSRCVIWTLCSKWMTVQACGPLPYDTAQYYTYSDVHWTSLYPLVVFQVAYELEDYYHSVQWLEESVRLFRGPGGEWSPENEGTLEDALDHLAFSHFKVYLKIHLFGHANSLYAVHPLRNVTYELSTTF